MRTHHLAAALFTCLVLQFCSGCCGLYCITKGPLRRVGPCYYGEPQSHHYCEDCQMGWQPVRSVFHCNMLPACYKRPAPLNRRVVRLMPKHDLGAGPKHDPCWTGCRGLCDDSYVPRGVGTAPPGRDSERLKPGNFLDLGPPAEQVSYGEGFSGGEYFGGAHPGAAGCPPVDVAPSAP